MKIIEFVKVDHITGIPATEAPTKHGPADPVIGIRHLWFKHGSPAHYFGSVSNDTDISAPGILRILDGEDFATVIDARKADLVTEAAELRYFRETGGITLPDGTSINTEREAQGMLNGAYQSLKAGLVSDTDWKATSGWVTVTLTELEPIAQAVADHVRRCFRAERLVADQIAAAVTVDDLVTLNLQGAFEAAYSA